MSRLSSHRRPWPYHIRLGSVLGDTQDRVGLMLLVKNGELALGKKQQMLDQVVPSQQEYGSAPVYRERTWTGKPTGGYGERVQSSYGDHRYYWGMDVTVSGGLFGKGPLLHPIAPSTAAGGATYRFIDGFDTASNTPTQFILAGTKVYKRTNDTNAGQVVDRDFPGAQAQDGVVFKGGFAGAANSLYVAFSNGAMWERTPSGTWTNCAMPAGFAPSRVEVVGTELWAADMYNAVVRKVTSDPKVAANWSGPIFIGDPSAYITAIRQSNNTLVIFKSDGTLWTLNSDGTVNDLFPGLAGTQSGDNGFRAQAWLGSLWFHAGPSFYRLDLPGAELTPMGPGRLLDNASPVRGEARVFCGWGGYQGYLALYNAQDTPPTSYLLSYGSWEMKQTEDGAQAVFDDQWDGSLAHWPNKIASALGVSGVSGTDRLYIGFHDGTWDWIKLVQNPLATGSGAEFNLGPSEIVFPLHTGMFQADIKHFMGFSIFGPVMRVGDEANLWYRIMAPAGAPPTDPTGNWLSLGEFTQNGQRIDAPPNLAGNALSLKVALSNSTTADTPVIEVVAIHERVVPAFRRDISGTVDGRWVISRLDGAAYRPSSEQVHKVMMDAAALPGSLTIELPDETVSEVAFFDYTEHWLPMQAGGGHSWLIDFQATQFRTLTQYGTIGRLGGTEIGELKGYTIGSLKFL